jgi:DNA polymerase-3 subunit epsilon
MYFIGSGGTHQAAKEHTCDWCGEPIVPGQTYERVPWIPKSASERFLETKLHLECEKARRNLSSIDEQAPPFHNRKRGEPAAPEDQEEPHEALQERIQRKREAALKRLRGWATRPGWVALDTETTGLRGHVIEVAVVGAGGEVLLNTLVQARRPITDGAQQVHGITEEDLDGAPTWEALWPELRRRLSGRLCLIYNAAFDLSRLRDTLRDHDLGPLPDLSTGCVMEACSARLSPYRTDQEDFEYVSLEGAASARDVELGRQTHRALADAELTRQVVRSYREAS